MASTAITAQGTTIAIGATDIGNVVSFTGFDGTANEIEVTNLASTAKEYLAGLADNGNFSMEIHPDYQDAGQNAVRAAAGGAASSFKITLSDGDTIDFDAVVLNGDSITGGVDAALAGSFSLRVTGPLTITSS